MSANSNSVVPAKLKDFVTPISLSVILRNPLTAEISTLPLAAGSTTASINPPSIYPADCILLSQS
ncbi:unnamed protein product [marine sediment metagenome]|uniref:Uncharacterized protein n=1 Tax=marine sediment metagenome TaxID=412755 RepID=X0YIB6_9ZZZZ